MRRALAGLIIINVWGCSSSNSRPTAATSTEIIREETQGASPTRPTAERHAVFDLVANRHLAHTARCGDLTVQAGSPGFAKYLRFARPSQPFALTQEQDGRAVARLGKKAMLDIPFEESQAQRADMAFVSLHAGKKSRLAVELNGKKLGKLELVPGWQVVRVPVEPKVGENRLRLDPGGPIALEWIRFAGEDLAEASLPALARDGLALAGCDSLAWFAHVPEGAHLEIAGEAAAGCSLTARASAPGAPSIVSGERAPIDLDLAPLAGRVVRLELEQRCGSETPTRISRAALTVPGPAPSVAVATRRPKHIVFWIMDTLRYDRVPLSFPGAVAEVPNMQRLADSGAVFTTFYPGGSESTVSHVSMFSSLRPSVHRVVSREGFNWKMGQGTDTIGQSVKAAGLTAVGITANGHIVGPGGFGWGFKIFENPMKSGQVEKDGGYPAVRVLDRAFELLDKVAGVPFFLYVGTIDTHVPWRAYEPWVSRYDAVNPQPYKGPFKKSATAGGIKVEFMLSKTPAPERDQQRLAAIYASDVSYQDAQLGRLLERLEKLGVLEDTMIVIAADHGEEFWEHGIAGHGGSLREVLVHTPMLIWYPPLFPRSSIAEGVEGIDLYPTMLDALGQPLPAALQGESLLPLAHGVGRGYPRLTIASGWEATWAARLERWKLVVENDGDAHLWDVEADPLQKRELADHALERRFVSDAFSLARVYDKVWKKQRWGNPANLNETGARELWDVR